MSRLRFGLSCYRPKVCRLTLNLVVMIVLSMEAEKLSAQSVMEGNVTKSSSPNGQLAHDETTWPADTPETTNSSLAIQFASYLSHIRNTYCIEASNFSFTFNLCQKGLEKLPLARSCKNRCGVRPSLAESAERCSCDDICEVYEDCCLDVHIECPWVHSEIREKFPKMSEVKPFIGCTDKEEYRYIIHSSDSNSPKASSSPISTIHTESTTPMVSSTVYSFQRFGWLIFLNKLPRVYDRSTGLLYQSDATFERYKNADSRPHHVSYIIEVPGEYIEGSSIDSYVFNYQWNKELKYTIEPELVQELRGCFLSEVVQCGTCSPSTVFLRDLCPDAHENQQDRLPQAPVPFSSIFSMKGRVSFSHNSCFHADSRKANNLRKLTAGQNVVKLQALSHVNGSHLVKLTGAPWKELFCSDKAVTLDQCEIKTCAHGHMLINKSTCYRPKTFDVTVGSRTAASNKLGPPIFSSSPILACTCLNIYAAIEKLGVLSLGNVFIQPHRCNITLTFAKPLYADDFMDGKAAFRKRSLTEDEITEQEGLTDEDSLTNEGTTSGRTAQGLNEVSWLALDVDFALNNSAEPAPHPVMTTTGSAFYNDLLKTLNSLDPCDDVYEELLVCLDGTLCFSFYKHANGFYSFPVTMPAGNSARSVWGITWLLVTCWTLHLGA